MSKPRSPGAVVVTYNSSEEIAACLQSLVPTVADILVVDGGSTDDTLLKVQQSGKAISRLLKLENCGYARAINAGVAETEGEFVLLSNADVIYTEGSVEELASYLRQNLDVGVVGPQLVFPNGAWQRSYGEVPSISAAVKQLFGISNFRRLLCKLLWPVRVDRYPRSVSYVDGAVMLVRRRAFEQAGGFDESFRFYGEDADFCHRLKSAGWRVVFDPDAVVAHVRGASSTKVERDPQRYLRMRVEANAKLFAKYHSAKAVKFYCKLEELHHAKMAALYRMARPLLPKHRAQIDSQILLLGRLKALWRNQASADSARAAEAASA
jgi:GT2 family glycosyltransferase